MKLIRLGQPASIAHLGLEQAEACRPKAGEVLMRVHACSLNYHDYLVVTGVLKAANGRVPLSDAAGEIVEVGPDVDRAAPAPRMAPGDAVISTFFPGWLDGPVTLEASRGVPGDHVDGFACEYATVPALALTRQPAGYTHGEAATLPCAALTAWRALVVEGKLDAGHTVLVQGTGGVSVFAVQFAKALGAQVIATSSSDEKLERLCKLGADHLINYRESPQWARQVSEITGGRGVDHVIEVGGAQTLAQSIRACTYGGNIALIGVLTGIEGPVPTAMLMQKNIRMQGITVGSRAHQLEMLSAIEAASLRPIIESRFPLERIGDAFRHQESGRHFGKIVLDV